MRMEVVHLVAFQDDHFLSFLVGHQAYLALIVSTNILHLRIPLALHGSFQSIVDVFPLAVQICIFDEIIRQDNSQEDHEQVELDVLVGSHEDDDKDECSSGLGFSVCEVVEKEEHQTYEVGDLESYKLKFVDYFSFFAHVD